MFDLSGFGLEIGPSYNPLVPKSSGVQIETIDHADQAGLIEKYRNDPSVDVSRIEPVDYVSDGRPMVEVIGGKAKYDFILASHVIEHTPNMLGFLNDCAELLKEDGCLALAVPDRRFCFDFFRPATSTGDILEAFRESRSRHTPGALFDHLAYTSTRGGAITWPKGDDKPFQFCNALEQAQDFLRNYDRSGPYIDCHAWQFTPSSFRLIVHDLAGIGLLPLRERDFHDTLGFEFFISLTRRAPHASLDRLELAEKAQLEAAQITLHGLPPDPTIVVAPPVEALPPPPPRKPPIRRLKKAFKRRWRALTA